MKKSIFLLFAVMLTMLSATAATYTVTQITDNGTGATSGSLSWAINTAAATGDMIAFNLTTGDVVTLSAALPTIDKSFTMEGINIATGNPVTIQVASPGVSTYRVFDFHAQGETCTLNNLILRGGDVSGFQYTPVGGVIYLYGGTLALNRCVVKEGKAQVGGGIASSGPTSILLLDGCTVNNNTATSTSTGGGGCAVSVATILNSTITGNTSLKLGGGIYQIYSQQSFVRLQIINTTISGNSAANGGGIYILGGSSSHTTHCYFLNDIVINNTAISNPDIGKTSSESYIYPYYLWSSYTTATVKTPYTTGDLGALADNCGPTQTMALSASAPAYQTGTSAYYNATDGYYYHNGTAYVKLLGGAPTYNVADKILTDQRGATRSATPSMGAYDGTLAPPSTPMQLVFTTTAEEQSIALPLYGTVDCTVDWGDGSATEPFTGGGDKPHTFAEAGTYTVSISGTLTWFGHSNFTCTGIGYLTEVLSFGNIGLSSLKGAFNDADNLTSVPATLPATVTDLSLCFTFTGQASITNLNLWDVSNVTIMRQMFGFTDNFNQDISGWNVSNVTDMGSMFTHAASFNQDISSWNVSKVANMREMFNEAIAFNQNIGSWDVSSVTDMFSMFMKAASFNQSISSWNVSNVTDMSAMFAMATSFNQNISSWNVSNVTNMMGMFSQATSFNQDISNWNVSNVTNMSGMFAMATHFNLDIRDWVVSKVANMDYMFYGATAFNQNIGSWNISLVTTMQEMFANVTLSTANYDALLTGWATQTVQSGVTFHGGNSQYSAGAAATARASLISDDSWTITDDGEVAAAAQPMQLVFTTTAASQSIVLPLYGTVDCTVDWGDGSATEAFTTTGNKAHTFATAGTYTVEISGSLTQFGDGTEWWTGAGYLTSVLSFGDIGLTSLSGAFCKANGLTSVPESLPATVTDLSYTFYSAEFTSATNLNLWDVSHVTTMEGVFYKALNFNQDIGDWNTSAVTSMRMMFREAAAFNQDISDWVTSSVTNMEGMFRSETAFNQNLGSWDISAVTNMDNMFYNVTLSTANYDALLIGWAAQTVKPNVVFSGGNSQYSAGAAATARASLISDDSWAITDGGEIAAAAQPMQLVFTTTAASQSIALPLYGSVNCAVDWGDGSATEDFTTTGRKPHTFAAAGTYTVAISGSLTQFGDGTEWWTGAGYLTSVLSFGDIGLTSLSGAFCKANGLTSVPESLPATVTDLSYIFYSAEFTSATNLNLWNVSHVTTMEGAFYKALNFNQNIGDWNTSAVTSMRMTFREAAAFNQDISDWVTSSVMNMEGMFRSETAFNQNLGSWDIRAVTNMDNMFYNVTLSTANYDALLTGWAAQTVKPNVVFHGGNSKYSAGTAATARGVLTGGTNLWTITDGGMNIVTYTWNGSVSSDWNTAGNWDSNYVPTFATDVIIPSIVSPAVYPVIASGTQAEAKTLLITATGDDVLTIEQGGKLTVHEQYQAASGAKVKVLGQ